MSKFKVGDKVIGACTSKQNYVAEGVLYTVLEADAAEGTEFIKTDASNGYWVLAERFYLEDQLPPVPVDGVYFNYDNSRKATLKLEPSCIAFGVTGTFCKVRLTPETALVMAHDLRRMAMDLKRKEKAQ